MAATYVTSCPACNQRELFVDRTESSDVKYCHRCSFEETTQVGPSTERRRELPKIELSKRERGSRSTKDRIRRQ